MKIWKHSHLDVVMLALSVGQFVTTLFLALRGNRASTLARIAGFVLLAVMTVYNIIVVSHLFTHTLWFRSPCSIDWCRLLNSINIGQSVQAYELTHVRNHHRYNNDQQRPDGNTKDKSSTFRGGTGGEHVGAFRYAFVGALETMAGIVRSLLSITRLWRVGAHEKELLSLLARTEARRRWELRQMQLDRMVHFLVLCLSSGDLVEMVRVLLPAGVLSRTGARERAELLRTLRRTRLKTSTPTRSVITAGFTTS